jgi:hypothetical protein
MMKEMECDPLLGGREEGVCLKNVNYQNGGRRWKSYGAHQEFTTMLVGNFGGKKDGHS